MLQRRSEALSACILAAISLLGWAARADDVTNLPRGAPAANARSPASRVAVHAPPEASGTADGIEDNAAIARPPQGPLQHPRPPHPTDEHLDYFTRRYEPAGIPLFGGDSDVGFEFGAVGTLSYFADGVRPYRWNMDLLLAASVKEGPSGAELTQQSFLWQIDAPELFGGGVRLNPEVFYSHTINYGYFGLGNASGGTPPQFTGASPGRYFEWIDSVLQARSVARVAMKGALSAAFAIQYAYVAPTQYAGSRLAQDAAARSPDGSPVIYGTTSLSLPAAAAGFLYDSRDNETFAHSGELSEIGVRFEQGLPLGADVHSAEAGAIVRGFVPLGGPFVAAGRLVANFQFGNVPFYELFQAGPFDQKEMPGGSAGVRGVPVGRYLGPIKIVGNIEARAMLVQFTLLQQKFTIGNNVFFDAGRIWSDYSFHSPLDGRGLGVKYGVGAGVYLLWGQAAMLRIEAAYSPDAVSENPHFPIGLYAEDGTMF